MIIYFFVLNDPIQPIFGGHKFETRNVRFIGIYLTCDNLTILYDLIFAHIDISLNSLYNEQKGLQFSYLKIIAHLDVSLHMSDDKFWQSPKHDARSCLYR